MPNPISLDDVASELQLIDDTSTAYVNRRTGETLIVQEYEAQLAEEPDDASLPEWQREEVAKVREVLASDDWLAMPGRWEINPYRIMERFCGSVAPDEGGDALEEAIRGRGAFRRFRSVLERLGLESRWYAHEAEAYRRVAARWLDENDLPYEAAEPSSREEPEPES